MAELRYPERMDRRSEAGSRKFAGVSAVIVGIAACGALLWQTAYWAREIALADIRERSSHTLNLVVENLRGELAKHHYQPRLLSTNPAFIDILSGPAASGALDAVNRELERIADVSGALDIYLMDVTGLTVAASNWAAPQTFIGRNFDYRPYFQQALKGQLGRFFALGTTSGERGYYFAYPVRDGRNIVGAVVVKIAVGNLEAGWQASDQEVLVVDRDGVVFLSSRPAWRFRTLAPLTSQAQARQRETRRYEGRNLAPLPIIDRADPGLFKIGGEDNDTARTDRTYVVLERQMNDAGWRVIILAETADASRQVKIALAVAGFMLVSLTLAATTYYQRRRRLTERLRLQEAARTELEDRVRQRTGDLTEANARLRAEVSERERTERELRATQSELIQASKLAALGQMSAGLSHELNQPLAAIRSYADNARAFITRGKPETATENLGGIAELTERMARIIRNLRTYARKEPTPTRPTAVAPALREALVLLDRRLADCGIAVDVDLPDAEVLVIGGDVRLQQVLVNLLSNAIDSMAQAARRELHVRVTPVGGRVHITIRDTGAGISDADIGNVFDPFFSTKGVGDGMGLGLSITYGIVKQFGGHVEAANNADGGAVFTVVLQRADSGREAAE